MEHRKASLCLGLAVADHIRIRKGKGRDQLLLSQRLYSDEPVPQAGGQFKFQVIGCFQHLLADLDEKMARVAAMRDRLIEGLSKIPHSALNGDRVNRLPNNVNFCFEGIEGESLLLLLDAQGVCASSGSACTSGSLDPSHVLLAIGRVHDVAHGSLRLSLSHYNTMEEIDHILTAVPKVVQQLRNMSPVWRDLQNGIRDYIL